ncbi:MAG: hypothetical protein ABEL76_08060, partial [Bradymonadaceae bacterium]
LSVVSGFTQVVGALAIPLAVGSGAGAGSLGLAAGLLSVLSMPIQAVGMFGAWLLLGAALVVIDDWESDARTGTW